MPDIKKQNYKDEKIKEYKFEYEGPVMCFGKVITNKFKSNTVATTEAKALSNIMNQYKRWNGLGRNYKLELDKKCIKCLGEYIAYIR